MIICTFSYRLQSLHALSYASLNRWGISLVKREKKKRLHQTTMRRPQLNRIVGFPENKLKLMGSYEPGGVANYQKCRCPLCGSGAKKTAVRLGFFLPSLIMHQSIPAVPIPPGHLTISLFTAVLPLVTIKETQS